MADYEWDEYDIDLWDCTGGIEGCPIPEHEFACYSMRQTQQDRNQAKENK